VRYGGEPSVDVSGGAGPRRRPHVSATHSSPREATCSSVGTPNTSASGATRP